jgi:hypothetical protein
MSLTILQIIGMIVFCIFGFQRGWGREFILLAAVILSVAFLSLKGGSAVAWLLFVGLPFLVQSLANRGGKAKPVTLPNSADATAELITTLLSFVLIIGIGLMIGNRVVPGPKRPVDNFLGLIPAALSGYIVTTYVLGNIPLIANLPVFSTTLLKIDFTLPNLLFLSVVGVLVIAVALIAGNAKKSAPPKK